MLNFYRLFFSILSATLFSIFGFYVYLLSESWEEENFGLYLIATACMLIAGISILLFACVI